MDAGAYGIRPRADRKTLAIRARLSDILAVAHATELANWDGWGGVTLGRRNVRRSSSKKSNEQTGLRIANILMCSFANYNHACMFP